jgi:hypothetical protein
LREPEENVKSAIVWLSLASVPWAFPAFCDEVNVGDIFYIDQGNGTTQFYLDNFTGPGDGCSTASGFPVCDDLLFSGKLTYSYFNGSSTVNGTATLPSPIGSDADNGDASYGPANFVLPVDAGDILMASFSGSLSPANFNTDLGVFFSDSGINSSDVVKGAGFALLTASGSSTSPVPEPSAIAFLLLTSLALLSRLRRRIRKSISVF